MGSVSVMLLLCLGADPNLVITGTAQPAGCELERRLARALEERRVSPVSSVQLELRSGVWIVKYGGLERELGRVTCEEAASLTAAIVQLSRPSAPVAQAIEEPQPGTSPRPQLVSPPTRSTRPEAAIEPARPVVSAPSPAPRINLVAPPLLAIPSAPPVEEPAPPSAPAAVLEAAPPASALQTQPKPVTPVVSLNGGGFVTSTPSIAPAISLAVGLRAGGWLFQLTGDLALPPQTQSVVISDTRSGELTSWNFATSLAFGHCWGAQLSFCPALMGGLRALSVHSSGTLYQQVDWLAVVPFLGADVSVRWKFTPHWALFARVAPMVPLGRLQAIVEGTQTSVSTGAVEGVAGLGVAWTPVADFF